MLTWRHPLLPPSPLTTKMCKGGKFRYFLLLKTFVKHVKNKNIFLVVYRNSLNRASLLVSKGLGGLA